MSTEFVDQLTKDQQQESSIGSVYNQYDNIRLDLDDLADVNLFKNSKRKQFKLNLTDIQRTDTIQFIIVSTDKNNQSTEADSIRSFDKKYNQIAATPEIEICDILRC